MKKNSTIILLISVFLISSCSKRKDESICLISGNVIGYNPDKCGCCPGWIIKTGNDTIKVLNLPIENQIREIFETSGFPINIKLDYENISGSCENIYKKITCIQIIY